ncbi:hypothetical protein [Streptomyces cyaneofuscatus]
MRPHQAGLEEQYFFFTAAAGDFFGGWAPQRTPPSVLGGRLGALP